MKRPGVKREKLYLPRCCSCCVFVGGRKPLRLCLLLNAQSSGAASAEKGVARVTQAEATKAKKPVASSGTARKNAFFFVFPLTFNPERREKRPESQRASEANVFSSRSLDDRRYTPCSSCVLATGQLGNELKVNILVRSRTPIWYAGALALYVLLCSERCSVNRKKRRKGHRVSWFGSKLAAR